MSRIAKLSPLFALGLAACSVPEQPQEPSNDAFSETQTSYQSAVYEQLRNQYPALDILVQSGLNAEEIRQIRSANLSFEDTQILCRGLKQAINQIGFEVRGKVQSLQSRANQPNTGITEFRLLNNELRDLQSQRPDVLQRNMQNAISFLSDIAANRSFLETGECNFENISPITVVPERLDI